MRTRLWLLIASLTLSLTIQAGAQQQTPPAVSSSAAAPSSVEAVNVDRLPLDLTRLERQLRQPAERQNWDGFRLRYTVEVFGTAPRIQFFAPQEVLSTAPIPYGAPTHKEMVDVMTPREFRQQPMDFSALMRWLQEKMK